MASSIASKVALSILESSKVIASGEAYPLSSATVITSPFMPFKAAAIPSSIFL